MSSTLHREGRTEAPQIPHGSLPVEPPPELAPHEGVGGALMMALPMLASVGSIVFVASAGGNQGRSFIAAGMFLVATLGFVVVSIDRQRKQRSSQLASQRREYLQYLSTIRKAVRAAAAQQREGLLWRHPAPASLAVLAEDGSRLWERLPDSESFLHARYGTSTQPLALELVPPESAPIEQLDPVCASALHRLLAVHRVQPDLPAAIDLAAFSTVEVVGDAEAARGLTRALIAQAAAFHGPEHLAVAVLAGDDAVAQWEWLKWLPHAASPTRTDAVGPSRMVAGTLNELADLLPADLADRPRFGADQQAPHPHLLIVIDGGIVPPGNHVLPAEGIHGVTIVDLPERWAELDDPTRLRLELVAGDARDDRAVVSATRMRHEPVRSAADLLDLESAEAFARRLAPLSTMEGPVHEDAFTGVPDLSDLLGVGEVRDLEVSDAWRPRPTRDHLRVPIGVAQNGSPVHLDLKEAAQQGMGPHGLVIGATGSGKSELLRSLVLGLVMTHSSESLNLVLVDFKGGATFAGLAELPHVSAVITNLEQELTLVDRMQDALSGEMTRRQEVLRRAGNFQSLRDYEKARQGGADLEPMPSLLIVVDEFSELLSAKPEFIDLFVAIGRLGRSLGLHLLLASQRLEEGRLRGLESHLSYRIGLRTFSAGESRTVLGVPDAYELPSVPGLGYLKADQSMVKFKSAYVSGPPPRRRAQRLDPQGGTTRSVLPFALGHVYARVEDDLAPTPAPRASIEDEGSVLDVVVDRIEGRGPAAHQVWLPPLDVPDTLDSLLDDLTVTPDLGLHSPTWRRRGGLQVPIGALDRPREQRRETLVADLSGANGHVAVVGGTRSGKSTMLRTLVSSLALANTPTEATFYVLDFGGGAFAPMSNLPHVAGVATRSEPDVVRRIIAEVEGVVDARERFFRQRGIDSMETYRAMRADGRADDGLGDVYLVIDGWNALRSDFDMLEMDLQALAQRSLAFGVHLVAASARWTDFRAAVRDQFGSKFEFRLGDTSDSEVDRKLAQLVPERRPGRGLVPQKLHFLGALPRLDAKPDPSSIGAGIEDLVLRVNEGWTGSVPRLRLLPARLDIDRLREQAGSQPGDHRILLGINERELAPVLVDGEREPHLLVFGDSRSGKTGVVRTIGHEVQRAFAPDEAQLVVVDHRRALLGEFDPAYQLHYLTNSGQTTPAIAELAAYLTQRLPGADVTPDQLRNRSWWSGAEVYVLVDDYDLVVTPTESPLAPLVPLMSQARDVGLHVVLTRRSGGASRALYEPMIQSMRDLAMPGLLLSGSPDEGPLIGTTKPQRLVPGRGQYLTRDAGLQIVQVAWTEPTV